MPPSTGPTPSPPRTYSYSHKSSEMDFSLYIIISPSICKIASAVTGIPQSTTGSQIFNMQKIHDVIDAGVTAIQLRGDTAIETAEYAKIAKAVHDVTTVRNVPLIIHDRVDIAVSAGAEGVELGKGCLDYTNARKLMGETMFVGVAVSTKRQAELAARANASYIIIGPVYKPHTGEFHYSGMTTLGTAGVKDILNHCSSHGVKIPHLVAGGISLENVQLVMFQSKSDFKSVDGVVLSYGATENHQKMVDSIVEIKDLMKSRPVFFPGNLSLSSNGVLAAGLGSLSMKERTRGLSAQDLLPKVPSVVMKVAKEHPEFGCLIPDANKALAGRMSAAIGSVPEFSLDFEEINMPGGGKVPKSCLINMNLITQASLNTYVTALKAYNLKGYPVILEPEGVNGLDFRRALAAEALIASGYVTLIKGNVLEILHLSGMDKGEEYNKITKKSTPKELAVVAAKGCRKLAVRDRCVVLVTGPVCALSDGERTVTVDNGALFLAKAGWEALGPVLAAFLAVEVNDPFFAVLSGLLLFTIASQQAAEGGVTKGPGTFLPAFIDEIWKISQLSAEETRGKDWFNQAIIEQVMN